MTVQCKFSKEDVELAVAAERERCAKWCDSLAEYYARDDDAPNSRRSIACGACAGVIRWPANFGKMPEDVLG